MLILDSTLGGTSAERDALNFYPAAAQTVELLSRVGSDTVYGLKGERLTSISVDKSRLRWWVQR